MAKKQKQPGYRVELEGLDIVTENCKLIVTGSDEKHFHLEQKGRQWLLMVNDMELFDRYGESFEVKLDRDVGSTTTFKLPDGNHLPIRDLVQLNVHERHVFYHLDLIGGLVRVAMSRSFINDKIHSDLQSIKVSKEQ